MNWKELKERKQNEFPAAELKRTQKEEKRKKYLSKIVDKVEKRLYSLCEKQEAGSTKLYPLRSVITIFESINTPEARTFIEEAIRERLTSQGIEVREHKLQYGWIITLP